MQTLQFISLCLLAVMVAFVIMTRGGPVDWRNASREPVGLAPGPAATPEAVVQVYAARTWGWRGYFGVHTWVAVKPAHAKAYTVYEVIGWRLHRGGSALAIHDRGPDERWFGSAPALLADKRGPDADALIVRIDRAARAYPYAAQYTMWPGPNSNTFTAWIGRAVPELGIDLPPTAIGKDYLGWRSVNKTPSGTGGQVNLLGIAGVAAGVEEGLEVNLLGLNFGVDPKSLSIKLPIVGRLGPHPVPKPKTITASDGATEPSSL